MTVQVGAKQIVPAETVDGQHYPVKSRSEVANIEQPTEKEWRVHVAQTESKDRETAR